MVNNFVCVCFKSDNIRLEKCYQIEKKIFNLIKKKKKCENCNNYIIFVVCCSFRGHRG